MPDRESGADAIWAGAQRLGEVKCADGQRSWLRAVTWLESLAVGSTGPAASSIIVPIVELSTANARIRRWVVGSAPVGLRPAAIGFPGPVAASINLEDGSLRAARSMRTVSLSTLLILTAACGINPSNQMQCLDSPDKVLVDSRMSLTGYRCRTARNECEKGFIQSEYGEEHCHANPRCQIELDECFCPPLAVCVCAGGSPPLCQPKH